MCGVFVNIIDGNCKEGRRTFSLEFSDDWYVMEWEGRDWSRHSRSDTIMLKISKMRCE